MSLNACNATGNARRCMLAWARDSDDECSWGNQVNNAQKKMYDLATRGYGNNNTAMWMFIVVVVVVVVRSSSSMTAEAVGTRP